MSYKHFEELPAWKKAARLYNEVLDMLEEDRACFSSGYRNQLDRAALSVSNNIAEGFERMSSHELINFLSIARGSAGEVRSMVAVVKHRQQVRSAKERLEKVHNLAQECIKQLSGWITHLENSEIQGKRHQTKEVRQQKQGAKAQKSVRTQFLLSLDEDHPLYHTVEARNAREGNRQ